MSRYQIKMGEKTEIQRSSGIWVSTAAGSTGAMKSAGGKEMKPGSKMIQFLVRELFSPPGTSYKLTNALSNQPIVVRSQMRKGKIFLDGAHISFPFEFGSELVIENSRFPLKILKKWETKPQV